jgi:NADPH:quinone reductase-like Zn-dependent oxidoreductase
MKAAYIDRQGGPEVFTYGELPDPVAGPGEVVVDIHAASVNAADWKQRSGRYYPPLKKLPYILGRDFSGVVSAVGEGVTDLKIGDAVFGVVDVGPNGIEEGTYAEKIAIKAAIVAKKPDDVSHVDMAALALTGLTALITVEDTIQLKKGETFLVQGGAGGVASFAVQLGKHLGARVVTTASKANHDYLRSLGADQVIDYRNEDFTKVAPPCDAVFDTVGGDDVGPRSFDVLKPGGRAAFIADGTKLPETKRQDVHALRPKIRRGRAKLERIVELVHAGAIRVPEVKTYPLSEAKAAHEVSESRHLRGKLVFKVR